MDRKLTRVTPYVYIDDEGKIYFCIRDFLTMNRLPDEPQLREMVANDLKRFQRSRRPQNASANERQAWPDILILEEQN